MSIRGLTIPELPRLRQGKTAEDIRRSVNNDKFFEFQQVYYRATGRHAEVGDDAQESIPAVASTLDLLEQGIGLLNTILSLDPGDRKADTARCEALQRILLEGTPTGSDDADQRTPLQRVLLLLILDVNARLHRSENDANKRLMVLATGQS